MESTNDQGTYQERRPPRNVRRSAPAFIDRLLTGQKALVREADVTRLTLGDLDGGYGLCISVERQALGMPAATPDPQTLPNPNSYKVRLASSV